MVDRKLVATTVSSREVEQKRREERKTTSCHVYTETQKKAKRMTQGKAKVVAEKSSNTQTATFHFA